MDLPPERRYSITTFGADGHRTRLGRYQLRVSGTSLSAVNRQGGEVASMVADSVERTGGTWTVRAADGAYWSLGGCNCGG